MSLRLLTHYERVGYRNGLADVYAARRGAQCRVASVPADSWRCRRHDRHILICLNERAEAERTALLRLVETR